jgi:glutathione peroxidase
MIDYSMKLETLVGEHTNLDAYKGKVLVIVNTASYCGLTPQYKGLEALYQSYADQGLTILGFPCNQFGAQEPKGADAIATFCERNYGVTFPMFAKIKVNGADTHPLYQKLKADAPGLLGTETIKWNFTKFLVDREGNVVKRYAPKDEPEELKEGIEALL